MAFNSQEYSWAQVTVVLLGRPLTGIQGVKYKTTQEKTPIYGRGDKPVAIQRGNKSYEGEIKVLQSELEALTKAAGAGNDIQDLEGFDITIAYVSKTGVIVTDVVKGAEFTEVDKGIDQGATNMEITLPFIALDVEKNK